MTHLRTRDESRPSRQLLSIIPWLLLAASLGVPNHVLSQDPDAGANKAEAKPDNGDASAPTMTIDPTISPEHLALAVKPLTRTELEAEVKGWQLLVRGLATKIAKQQAAILTMNAEPASENDDSLRARTMESITQLKAEQSVLLEKFQIALSSYERKGGDVEEYTKYIAAQHGVELKVTDAEMLWNGLRGWLKSEHGGWMWARRLLAFFLILIVSRIVTAIVTSLVHRWLRRSSRLSKLAESLISRSIRHALMLLGLLIALTALGINVGPLLAAVGATGFIVGFALQGTLSNFASGLMILINRPFDVGDVVEAGGVTGTVSAMTLVSTTFLSFDNQKIIVPNNEIWGNVITNITANETRRVDLTFSVSHGDDLDRARQILEEEAGSHPNVLEDPQPVIKMHEIGDSTIKFICRPWAKTADYWTVFWELTATIKRRFDEEGISFPFPQREVHLRTEAVATGGEDASD